MFKKDLFRRFAAIFQISAFLFTLSPAGFAKDNSNKPLTVFSNTAPITINSSSAITAPSIATVYPSQIDVSGMTGTITNVEVTLKGVTYTQLNQLDVLLVSPGGAKYIFLSDGGGGNTVEDQVYTFTDAASTTIPVSEPTSGTYRPTSGDASSDTFPSPAPAAPYSQPPGATFASVFNGSNPNGAWTLYAVDDAFNTSFTDAGSINSGWALTITTDGAPQTFANSNYIALNDALAAATPYGSTINVSGLSGVVSSVKVSLTGLSHTNTPDIDILLVSPNGSGMILMSDAGNFSVVSNVNLTFDDAAGNNLGNPIVSGTFKPTNIANGVTDIFQAPAPLRSYANQLSSFNGFNPNGDWKLFVIDDGVGNSGSISGGWSLDITTVPTPTLPIYNCTAPNFNTSTYATGANPTNLAVSDFNNDTKTDVAVTNQASNDVSVLLGNGDGTFGAQTSFTAGSGPYSIVAGKFNADNNFDLAVANSGSNNVSILLGNGDGTFSAPTNFAAGTTPISIASADFNNDTKPDLAIANFGGFFFGTVTILLGNGTGGFTLGTPVRTRTQPSFVATTNFNGDGNQDLIVTSFAANSVSTFTGNGSGIFQLKQNLAVGAGPVSIEVANFGTDSNLDFAVTNYNSDTFTICLGNSLGNFSCGGGQAVGTNPISITSGDYTNTGIQNPATALSGSNQVDVVGNKFSVGLFPNAIDTADFNGDGKPDLITANSGTNDLSVLINNCIAARGNLYDYNGDRKTDFSVFRPSSAAYYIPPISSNGIAKLFGRPNDKLVPADYNGDRLADFAYYRPENGLWFVIDTNSRPIYFLQFGLPDDIPVPADFDGDAKADLALWRPSNGTWYVRRSLDNSLQTTQFGIDGDKPVAADFDGDDKADLGIFRPSTGVWYIWKSSDGQFIIRQFGISEDRTVVADYDGDNKADIAVWRPSTAVWYILRSSDDDFRAVAWGVPTDIPTPGDYDGDGKFDYAIWRPGDRTWYIQKSSDGGTIGFFWGLTNDLPIPNAFVR